MISSIKRLSLLLLILGLWVPTKGFAATPKCEVDDTIVFAGLNWDSAAVHQHVARFIVESAYGCKTDAIIGTTMPLLTALGRGDIHISMEIWKDNITEAWDKLEDAGKVSLLGVNFPDAEQGFFVPTYMIKGDKERGIKAVAPDLKHVNQLNSKWELFRDVEQPNKGRFYNCILGWSCESVNTKKLHAYKLNERFVNFKPGTAGALAAAFAGSYQKGIPFVGYYWGPTWILGKFDLTLLEEPPYDKDIWAKMSKEEFPTEVTAYPTVKVYIGVNNEFRKKTPQIMEFLGRYRTSNKLISGALAYMQEDKSHTAKEAAMNFLKKRSDIWGDWLDPDQVNLVRKALGQSDIAPKNPMIIHIDKPINKAVSYLIDEYTDFFEAVASPIRTTIISVESALNSLPWWLLLLLFTVIGYWSSRSLAVTALIFTCIFSLYVLGIWNLATQTLTLMFLATTISVMIGIPLGIVISLNDRVRSLFLPVLDAMQTMPSFVYLIPAMMLFGLGKVPAIFATVIYAISPLIKLTDLGIRQVDAETTEAATSFGANKRQLLTGVQLPLAMPSIMAGINQTTMLALSMVVVASMIGARGLGEEVLLGIQKLDVGRGFTGGIGIVALAIALDRITQGFGKRLDKTR